MKSSVTQSTIDNVTKEIVQISDNVNPATWAPDLSIVDPYIPNWGGKMKITEINTVIKSIEYTGEILINLQELYNLLMTDFSIEMEECIITPYYIQDNKRMELYQYEFYCTDKLDFEDYILRLTGKEKIEDVSEEVFYLRRNCFSMCKEPSGLADFLKFLFQNKILKEEVKQAFGSYAVENLYAVVY